MGIAVYLNIQASEEWSLLEGGQHREEHAHNQLSFHQLVQYCHLLLPQHHRYSHVEIQGP